MINEKIKRRIPNEYSGNEHRARFNLARFKHIIDEKPQIGTTSLNTARNYATKHLNCLGCGSSRCGYLLTSQKVLKVAIDRRGLAQNEAEIDVFTNPLTKPVITKIYDYDQKFRWLICELIHSFDSDDQFRKEIGLKSKTSTMWIISKLANIDTSKDSDEFEFFVENYNEGTNPNFREFMLGLNVLIRKLRVITSDLYYEHFGKSVDGRIVLLDYGFTRNVEKEFY